jgi:FAD synthase
MSYEGNLELKSSLLQEHQLLPGVYYGICRLKGEIKYDFLMPYKDKVYQDITQDLKAVISIGTNVQYQDKSIKFEVMILEDIPPKEFYGQELMLSLCGFIRPEGYFPSFACFICAMENDIYVTKTCLKDFHQSRRQRL